MDKRVLRNIIVVTVMLAAAVALLTLLIPSPHDIAASSFHSLCFITSITIIAHFGGAFLFVLGLRGFSTQFKAAYIGLVIGFATLAIGLIQLPVFAIFHLNNTSWASIVAVPFVISLLSLYIGARGFARLFGVRSWLSRAWIAIPALFVIAGLTMLIPPAPHDPAISSDMAVQLGKISLVIPAGFATWTAILAFQARKRAGSLYIPATAWLAIYLGLDSLNSIVGVVVRMVQPDQVELFNNGYLYIVYAVSGLVLLKAGLEFNKIRFGRDVVLLPTEQTFFGRPKNVETGEKGGLADILTYMAGLASDQEAIDPILDELRLVTVNLEAGRSLDADQQERLAEVQLRLENYLAEQEPIRPVDRQKLRESIRNQFAPLLQQNPIFAQKVFGSRP